jgi:pimeloyl-ACP methyl ester carboxylesterase
MPHVRSRDGTRIAYERSGEGETVIVVDGAMGSRALGFSRGLAELLAPHFNVIVYDRRGRGESGDTPPYAVEREVEDIEALIFAGGGAASLYGISSGAALALQAAVKLGDRVGAVALYEPPYNDEDADLWRAYERELRELLAADRRGDAVALFLTFVGAPPEQIAPMRETPLWPVFEASAPTLAYDAAVLGEDRRVPRALAARLRTPTLVMNGSASYPFMRVTARALAEGMPAGRYRELPGQRHDVDAKAIAPVLVEFFRSAPDRLEGAAGRSAA